MASFSRGTLAYLARPAQLLAPSSRCCLCTSSLPAAGIAQRRHLLRPPSQARYISKKATAKLKQSRPPPSAGPILAAAAAQTTSTATRRVVPLPYVEQLARRGVPTELYEAPSHAWLRYASYTTGVFCVSYATYNYASVVLNPPPGVDQWVVVVYSLASAFMGSMGAYFWLGTGNIVRSIRVVPRVVKTAELALPSSSSRLAAPASAASRGAARPATTPGAATQQKPSSAAPSGTSPVYLEIKISRAIPFLRPRVLRVDPGEVVLPARFSQLRTANDALANGNRQLSTRERLAQEAAERARRKAEIQYDRDHLMTVPFRHMRKAMGLAWAGIRRALVREGFIKVKIAGKQYRFDVTGGWALEDGRALDRLITLEPAAGNVVRMV